MASVQNLEEAANVASEFIYSLDNIPHEVNFLLQEIKVKEARAQELQAEIDRDSARYIRHVIKGNSIPSSPSSRAPSPKDSVIPGKIEAAFVEINQLSAEKCALSQTLVDLITRTRSRLDSDIARVRFLQGETPSYEAALGTSYSAPAAGAVGETITAGVKNPAIEVTASLRNALQATPSLPDLRAAAAAVASAPSPVSASAAPATKRRRTGANSSIKLSATPTKGRSASPVAAPPATAQRTTSRLARASYTRQEAEDEEMEEDLGEEDPDAEDDRLYCFCQKPSYGDMIACDNEGGCPFEWFHLSCVGMKQPTPEKWYCSVCSATLAKKTTSTAAGRKGRKK